MSIAGNYKQHLLKQILNLVLQITGAVKKSFLYPLVIDHPNQLFFPVDQWMNQKIDALISDFPCKRVGNVTGIEIMIDLKRNSKKELVPAKGVRTRKSSIYHPN